MNNETIQLIEKLAERTEELGGNLFEIAMKQQAVEVINLTILLVAGLIVVYICYRGLRWSWVEIESDDNGFGPMVLMASAVVGAVMVCVVVATLFNLIQWIVNPEYAALEQIKHLLLE